LAAELLDQFEAEIETLTLIPSDGGKFEITVNKQLLYSKLQTRRHAEPGEVSGLVRKYLRDGG
jgi:selenoprotein W-related protein